MPLETTSESGFGDNLPHATFLASGRYIAQGHLQDLEHDFLTHLFCQHHFLLIQPPWPLLAAYASLLLLVLLSVLPRTGPGFKILSQHHMPRVAQQASRTAKLLQVKVL